MKFSIVFDTSGDELEFDSLSHNTYELLEYYVDNLTHLNANQFWLDSNSQDIETKLSKLHNSIVKANEILYNVNERQFGIHTNSEGYLDQQLLNRYHADWVRTQKSSYNIDRLRASDTVAIAQLANQVHDMFPDEIREPSLGTVLSKLGLNEIYDETNTAIHTLERAFDQLRFKTTSWTEIKNPYPKELATIDICNFRIAFNHLGRSLYEKYQNFDTDLVCDDENTFDQLLGFVDISLIKPRTHEFSEQYVQWCKQHNKVPSGCFLNIGNLVEFENRLTDYRVVIYRNIKSINSFSIKLNKG